ncbi:VirB4 family type IV secretion system protein [Bacillus pumilus]|uniref:VirB4 family type IV secretion system protein n=1 Tax=Bacillus pumilus TaxID=1408 RepID=UPI00077609EC|nr:hypothetical protein [Bacillus pumilus]
MSLLKFLKGRKAEKVEPEQINEIKGLIDRDTIDKINPFVFELQREYIASGGNYIKPYVIMSYPKRPQGNWLLPLKKLKGNVVISQHMEPASTDIMQAYYNDAIKNKQAELLRTIDPKKHKQIESEIKAAEAQLEESMEERSTFLYLYTYILIQAQSEKELNLLEKSVNNVLNQTRLQATTPYRRMDDAFWSTLPIGMNELKEYSYSMTNSNSASSFFPFDDNEIHDLTSTSTIEGKNLDTNSNIAVDYRNPDKTLNRNKIILGASGTGKSTYIGKDILIKIAENIHYNYLIDPENESSERVKRLGGTVLDLSSASPYRLNPFDIHSVYLESDEDHVIKSADTDLSDQEIEGLINQKVERMKGIHRILMPEMDRAQLSIISYECKKLYTRLREVKNIGKMKPTDFPILEDLYNALMKLKETDIRRFETVQTYCDVLENCVFGSSTILNGHTNIDLTSKLISFNLKPLQTEKDMQSVVYLNTFSYLWEIITSTKSTSNHLFCDEFHFLLTNPDSRDFFKQAFKRFRKYNAGVTVTTQQIEDILQEDTTVSGASQTIGASLVGNSYTIVLFGMAPNEVEDVRDKLKIKLSEKEQAFLRRKRQSEALFLYGEKRAKMEVKLTTEELRLFNPARYKKLTGKDPNIVPDWASMVFLSRDERAQIKTDIGRREGSA